MRKNRKEKDSFAFCNLMLLDNSSHFIFWYPYPFSLLQLQSVICIYGYRTGQFMFEPIHKCRIRCLWLCLRNHGEHIMNRLIHHLPTSSLAEFSLDLADPTNLYYQDIRDVLMLMSMSTKTSFAAAAFAPFITNQNLKALRK